MGCGGDVDKRIAPFGRLPVFDFFVVVHEVAAPLTSSRKGPIYYDVWLIHVMHSFSGADGDSPGAGLTADSAGNLYGTTTNGGVDPGFAGTVFKLTPGANYTGRTRCCIASLAERTAAPSIAALCSTVLGTSTARHCEAELTKQALFTRSLHNEPTASGLPTSDCRLTGCRAAAPFFRGF
jgi:hypothetical protein